MASQLHSYGAWSGTVWLESIRHPNGPKDVLQEEWLHIANDSYKLCLVVIDSYNHAYGVTYDEVYVIRHGIRPWP